MDHFGTENRMVVGDSDEYERQNFPRRRPRLKIDLINGIPVPSIDFDDNGDDELDRIQQKEIDDK